MSDDLLPIHETFGPTVQGEGYWSGVLVDFIRLHGCPVGCPWCDTGYANGGGDIPRQMVSIKNLISQLTTDRVVISGGEPFIHSRLPLLVQALINDCFAVHIETSGAVWRDVGMAPWITLSPKAHVSPKYPVDIRFWLRANEVKIVIEDGTEVEFYRTFLDQYSGPVYLQPQWNVLEKSMAIIIDLLQKNSTWRLSVQSHKFIGVR